MIFFCFFGSSECTELEKEEGKNENVTKGFLFAYFLPVLTDESESKNSSFLSILDDVFCVLDVAAMCGLLCCCCISNVSSLSSHCETLSNLSNFDDSSISTFFTINFVVRLRVSIFDCNRSCKGIECVYKII